MRPEDFVDRSVYRRRVQPGGLVHFAVSAGQSDLLVSALRDLSGPADRALREVRSAIEGYVGANAGFAETLEPWPRDPQAPDIVRGMIAAGAAAGVGPMAAVAGAVAAAVGRALLADSPEVIVENGGDIFAAGSGERVAAVFAGDSPLSMKLGLKLPPAPDGLGLCTSSGTVGGSKSFGKCDAAVVLSADAALADAVATALGNRVSAPADLVAAVEWAGSVPGVDGVLVIIGEDLAARGSVELVEL